MKLMNGDTKKPSLQDKLKLAAERQKKKNDENSLAYKLKHQDDDQHVQLKTYNEAYVEDAAARDFIS